MAIDNDGWPIGYSESSPGGRGKTILDIVKTDEMKRAIRLALYTPEELENIETEEDAKKQISEQIYTNSIIADQKMNNVKNSTKCLFVLVVLLFVLLIV